MVLPRLYAIADAELLTRCGVGLRTYAEELAGAGVRLAQYRNKVGRMQEMLADAVEMREAFAAYDSLLVMNDRADVAVLAGFHGVHVGQEDLLPEDVRRVIGAGRMVGVSTHTLDEVAVADASCADYVAIGPVFATGTKADAAVVVGLDGVKRARAATGKPLVAIGGVTRSNARSVVDAGADAVAVISALLVKGESPGKVAGDFLELLR